VSDLSPWSPRLGEHVETARQRVGLSRQQLADRLDVSEETLRLWERGAVQPSPERLAKLIAVLALDASQWPAREPVASDLPPLARRLRQERDNRAMTQAEVARLLDIAQATYAGWETGRSTPGSPFLSSLSTFLGMSAAEIANICASPFVVDTTTWPEFGRLLGERRADLRLTRAALADGLGIAAATVVAWELGYRSPRPQQVRGLAEILKVDMATLASALPRRASPTTLGELILARQQELGLRLADVAVRAGTTEATISRWVQGRNRPAAASVRRLAAALELPFADVARAAGHAA
jgi:transcriptional regulator with XRE-family HTH domain